MKKKRAYAKVANVPIIMQMEALECGAACLAMILAYAGKWVPLEEARIKCGVSRDGSNAKNILKAARAYGMNAKGYQYDIAMLKQLPILPCILFWEFNHFVVLNGFRRDCAIINDPGRGRIAVSMKDLESSYTGVCLCLSPSSTFLQDGHKTSIWTFAREKLMSAKAAFCFVFITTLITTFMNIIFPVFTRIFLDRILSGMNREWLPPFLLFLICICVISIMAQWIQAIYTLKLEGKLAISANAQFMWHLIRLPLEFFTQRSIGDLALRKINNESMAHTFVITLAPLCLHSVMMIIYIVLMLQYQVALAAIGFIGVFMNIILSKYIANKRLNAHRVQLKNQGLLWSTTIAGLELIESIKASGAECGFFERWAGYQAALNTEKIRNGKITIFLGELPSYLLQIANLCILGMGVTLIFNNSFSVGMLFAFQGLMTGFLAPLTSLVKSLETMQTMRVHMERSEDVLSYPTDVKEELATQEAYEKLQGNIELKNITFGYSRLLPPLIKDFSMILEPGKKVAFVGGSGCGKSTLSKLISGLYQPWSGTILFDGQDKDNIHHHVFTSSLAVVDQEITLFEDSIAQNIKMWDNSIADFEMILAARDADIHADIVQREGGFQYKVQAGGKDFSGGQRQRMEIARVLAQDPTILILDEATSALDAKTEFEVINAIQKRGITCIIIAHRLSTIRDCDEIIVLHHGDVVERGKHDELYALNGYYTKLVTSE